MRDDYRPIDDDYERDLWGQQEPTKPWSGVQPPFDYRERLDGLRRTLQNTEPKEPHHET